MRATTTMLGAAQLLVLLSCGALGEDLSKYFATVRTYQYSGGRPAAVPAGCTLAGVYYVSRHGSRYPTGGKIEKQGELADFVHKYDIKSAFKWMKKWTPEFTQEQEGMLSERGAADLNDIGKRFAENYRALLFPYTPNAVTTQSTGVPRTAQTAAAFTWGAVGNASEWARRPWVAVSESKKADRVLRFFNACPRFISDVKENKSASSEMGAWLKAAVPGIAKKVEGLTGIPAADLVSSNMVPRMWDTCTYEQTVLGNGRWCALFDAEDAQAFEYAADMDKYYVRGHGVALANRIAAPLLQSALAYAADAAAAKPGTPRARLMFAHAETVLPLKALLGLHRDPAPLLASASYAQRAARLWRTSDICTMAANLAFVVARCPASGKHLLQLLESESPVDFPAVQGCASHWCPLDAVKAHYASATAINFDDICSVASPKSDHSKTSTHSKPAKDSSDAHIRNSGARVAASALALAALLLLAL
eukprot:m51a1_g8601 hypothetical protein (478) ;mRNA; f:158167-159985